MDDSISFGDVEQTQPDHHQRPDQNYHYAVVPVGAVGDEDLPIYIDIDTALDIESHAQEDTSIELGGVLLGGQYLDDQGQPFVLVRDSLRAEDYEATKSSFKFTHETWEKISRQRDRFPAGTEIVGWYHTHPDWGVFLSGMDMFICQGFFNRPLDVALVVDPCRHQRGWFHWVQQDGDNVKRETNGFYLFGSRFRLNQMQQTSDAMLSKEGNMMVNQRVTEASSNQPIIHFHQPDQRWFGMAVIAMLLTQTLAIIGGLYLFSLAGGGETSTNKEQAYRQVIAELLPPSDTPESVQQRLDQLVQRQSDLAQSEAKVAALTLGADTLMKSNQELETLVAQVQTRNQKLLAKQTSQTEELKSLRELKDEVEASRIQGERESLFQWWTNWVNLAAVALLAAAVFFGGMITAAYRAGELGQSAGQENNNTKENEVEFES